MLIDHTHRSWIVGTFAVGMGAVTLYFVLTISRPGVACAVEIRLGSGMVWREAH